MFTELEAICQQAVAEGVVPGLCVAVGREGKTAFARSFGARRTCPAEIPNTTATVYDLASLSKALCTSVLAMRLRADGRLDLDAPLPGAAHSARLLLAHAAGLPAHRTFYRELLPDARAPLDHIPFARAATVARARATTVDSPPGSRSVYSDLGFILLGDWLETLAGERLDTWFARAIAGPLALADTGFFPLPTGAPTGEEADARAIAPTEDCAWRGRLLCGEVHDQNTWAMGGVAGHAGLFGSLASVSALAHALVAAYHGVGHGALSRPLVDRATIQHFWQPAGVPDSTWRLGWDGPAPAGSLAGERLSRAAVGHLGFTGCSLWIDPAQATFVIVLSNRIHPVVRDDGRFRSLRPALNDAALAGLGYRADL